MGESILVVGFDERGGGQKLVGNDDSDSRWVWLQWWIGGWPGARVRNQLPYSFFFLLHFLFSIPNKRFINFHGDESCFKYKLPIEIDSLPKSNDTKTIAKSFSNHKPHINANEELSNQITSHGDTS